MASLLLVVEMTLKTCALFIVFSIFFPPMRRG